MTKYTKAFRIKVAELHLTGQDGYKSLAIEFGIMHGQVRAWSLLSGRIELKQPSILLIQLTCSHLFMKVTLL